MCNCTVLSVGPVNESPSVQGMIQSPSAEIKDSLQLIGLFFCLVVVVFFVGGGGGCLSTVACPFGKE